METKIKMQFNPDVAKNVGVEEAIMYSNIEYWCEKNKANNKNLHDEKYWTYNSMEAFQELFPFWTIKQIKRILKNLKRKEYIQVGNYNKMGYDRTSWYSALKVQHTAPKATKQKKSPNGLMSELKKSPNGLIHCPKWANGKSQMGSPIPNNKPNNKPASLQEGESTTKNIVISKKRGVQTEFGNPLINSLIVSLKEFNGTDGLDGSVKWNRIGAKNVADKIKREFLARSGNEPTDEHIEMSFRAILSNADSFHCNNMTGFQYINKNFYKIAKSSVGNQKVIKTSDVILKKDRGGVVKV